MIFQSVDAVAVGLDWHISYMKLIRAASYLAKPECHYVATNEDYVLPTKGKIVIPGMYCTYFNCIMC